MTGGRARNLELKVRCAPGDLERVRARADAAGIGPFHRMRQIDTYFRVSQGRLKLRAIEPDSGPGAVEMIAYHRADLPGSRWSHYHRVPLDGAAADGLRQALADVAGVLAVVDKTREVAIARRTRIHLDRVRGLGDFVELETVVAGDEDAAGAEVELELDTIGRTLGLDAYAVVAGSYSDLILDAHDRGEGEDSR